MRWHPGSFFGCIAIALAQKEHAAADDVLGMLQSSLRVKRSSNETDMLRIEGSGVPAMQAVERLEKLVMARVHGEVTGDNKLAGNLNTSIKYMFGGIIVNTATNQKMIKTAIAAFKNCKVKMWNSYTKAVLLQKKYWKLSQIYPKCMVTEDKLKLAKIVSARSVDHLKETIKQLKALLKAQGRTCGNVCANRGHESYHEQLHRLA